MRRCWQIVAAACVASVALNHGVAAAPELTADLTERQVQLAAGYTGVHTILFGVASGGGDVIVVIRGPSRHVTVREKRDVAGVWLNRASVRFDDVPAYYAVWSTRPPATLLSPAKLAKAEIGLDTLDLKPDARATAADQAVFHDALIDDLSRSQLLVPTAAPLALEDGRLFRAAIDLPAAVPTGNYSVTTLLVRQGAIVASVSLPLQIVETGIAAAFGKAAIDTPVFSGLLAVASAASIGWLASIVFRSSE